jgi:hypothetical protein
MATKALDKRELVKVIRKLNRAKLVDAVETKGDVNDLAEDFIQAIEEIDDSGKIDKVAQEVIDHYEEVLKIVDGKADAGDDDGDGDDAGSTADFDEDAVREELEDFDDDAKKFRAFIKDNELDYRLKVKDLRDDPDSVIDALVELMAAKADDGGEDDAGDTAEFDEDEVRETLEDFEDDAKQFRAFIKENGLKYRLKVKDLKDDPDTVIDAIIEEMSSGGAKEKSTPSRSKQRSSSRSGGSSSRDLPKGLRKGTAPAMLYEALAKAGSKGMKWSDLAKVFAKEKDIPVEKAKGQAFRMATRKVAGAVPVVVTFSRHRRVHRKHPHRGVIQLK